MKFIIKDGKPYCEHSRSGSHIAEVYDGNETGRVIPVKIVDGKYECEYVTCGLWACPECHKVYYKIGLFK